MKRTSFSIAISVPPEYASSACKWEVRTPSRRETRVGQVVQKLGFYDVIGRYGATNEDAILLDCGCKLIALDVENCMIGVPKGDGCFKEIPIDVPGGQQRYFPGESGDAISIDLAQGCPYLSDFLKRWRDSFEARTGN
ncbi:hypothetical protein CRG98_047733 [Punica granatum]|uniref:Uncharacterized protein n=1 Tax=Punica granatum TaxID=22663 RepID=A0A2I0HKQ5_PUNGR|nr:hypothetical protein CRG98_047733 [Punica granatum]